MQVEITAFVTTREYAAIWGVHPSTVMRWIKKKRIPADQPNGEHGEYFIPRGARPIVDHYPPAAGWPKSTSTQGKRE